MFPRGHPAPGGFSVGCSPWGLSLPQCEVLVGCGSSRLDLPWSNHFQAAVPQWWPCHDVRWPWALRCTIGPPMWTGSSQECIASHVPFHMPFPMFLKFFFLCQLPQAATACSQTCVSCLRAPWVLCLSSLGIKAVWGTTWPPLTKCALQPSAAKALWFTPDTVVYSSAL